MRLHEVERRHVAPAALLFLLLGSAGVGRGEEMHGRLRETFQILTDDSGSVDTVLQNYEVNFKNNITQSAFWQARLRALLTGLNDPGAASADTMLIEPFVQVVYQGVEWQASGGARFTDVSPKGNRSTALDSRREDLFGHVSWSRENLPQIAWSGYRISLESDSIETSREDRSLLTTSFGRGPGNINFGLENRWFTDPRTGFERTSVQATANGDIRRSFVEGRLVVGGQALAVEGRVDEEAPIAVDVEVLPRPRKGLFAEDTTPLSGALADTPALIDGDVTTSAVDLSGDFRNIGVDLGFDDGMDTAFVYLERRLLPGNERDYDWEVYTSTDGDFWIPWDTSPSSSFDGLLNRFEIRFDSVSSRWLKVVNTRFSRNEPPLSATEIQVLRHESRSGRQSREQSSQSGNVSMTWQATRILDFGFNTFANRQASDGAAGARSDVDLNSMLTATVRPGRTATTVRLQAINRRSTLGRPETDRIASVTFAAAPLSALDLSITGTHRRNTARGDLLVAANSVNFRGAARFLHDVETSIELGILRQDEGIIGRTTNRRHAQLVLVSTLRPGLFLNNIWTVERVEFSGVGTGLTPNRTDLDMRTRLSYRPTRVLGAAIEVLYQDLAGRKGYSHLYDLDWLPFPGGALQVQFSMRQDRRSVTGNLREETRTGVRWTINPTTLLDVAYTIVKSGTTTATDKQEIVSAFLEYRF